MQDHKFLHRRTYEKNDANKVNSDSYNQPLILIRKKERDYLILKFQEQFGEIGRQSSYFVTL